MKTLFTKEAGIDNIIKNIENFCREEGLSIELTYQVEEAILEAISKRSKALPSMYFVSTEMLKSRLKNGCFLLKKQDELIGHIFAHKHLVNNDVVYERSSLWIAPEYRSYNLGLFLMHQLTELFRDEFLISIAREPSVHYYNELLGMTYMTLSQMSETLVEALEKIGKLRDEIEYKYYVNPYFKSKIR